VTEDRNARIETVFPEWRDTLRGMAWSMTPNPYASVDDLIQEGYIAMWRAADADAENLAAYLTTAARHRMLSVKDGRPQLGSSGPAPSSVKPRGEQTRQRIRDFQRTYRSEHGDDPSQAQIARELGLDPSTVSEQVRRMRTFTVVAVPSDAPLSLDGLLDAGSHEPVDPRVADLLDSVTLAYHHGEIREAIAALPESYRDYVVDLFWHGLTERESNRKRATGVRWERVRLRLVESLAHLSGAA
jgi:DNA-directed RNA polymerase specialized sigma24 family protein